MRGEVSTGKLTQLPAALSSCTHSDLVYSRNHETISWVQNLPPKSTYMYTYVHSNKEVASNYTNLGHKVNKKLKEKSEFMKVRPLLRFIRPLSYVQGQWSGPKTREYFYYIDHQGQVSWAHKSVVHVHNSWGFFGFTAVPWRYKGEELYNLFQRWVHMLQRVQ